MTCTPAQIAANRKNAGRSTGPKTAEGKARSRRNSLKHGLTGQGIVLSSEVQDEVERRFDTYLDELRPNRSLARQLVHRVAFLSVRLERCERFETTTIGKRVRHAIARFDDDRRTEVEAQAEKIYSEPATTVRRLRLTPEGINWLLEEWATLRSDLLNLERDCWTGNHRTHFDALMGRNPGGYRLGRIKALSDAVDGFFLNLDSADGAGLEGKERAEWARSELARMIDAEVDRLKDDRERIDVETIALDRAEAVDRALFDPSPEMALARKYEAATERGLFKALKEFRAVQADPTIVVEVEEIAVEPEVMLEEPEDSDVSEGAEAEAEVDVEDEVEVEADEPPAPIRPQFASTASAPVVTPRPISGPLDTEPRFLHQFGLGRA